MDVRPEICLQHQCHLSAMHEVKKAKSKTKEKGKNDATSSTDTMIIIGEMPSVEFVSDEEENKHIADSGCR